MSQTDEYARLIEAHIPESSATIEGGGGKFEATVISDAFDGKSLLEQHRMVKNALGDQIQSGEIHAVSIRAYTPAKWREMGGEL